MYYKTILIISFCLIVLSNSILAENLPGGARSAGLAHASVSIADFWSLQNNQAGIAGIEKVATGIYVENRYLLQELSYKMFGLLIPTRPGVFGLNINHFGFNLYQESKLGLVYARKFSNSFSMGIELNFHRLCLAEGLGNKNQLTFELGLIYKPFDKFSIGFHAFNPTGTKKTSNAIERIPTVFRFGFQYMVSDDLFLVLETKKSLSQNLIVKVGCEYGIKDIMYIRAGIASVPFSYSFGFGLKIKKLLMDISSSYHHYLGYSPQVSLTFQF